MGKCNHTVITREEELATVGMRTYNDPSEGRFATFTGIFPLVAESIYPAMVALDK